MAPRPSGARRSLFPEPEHVYELGVAGRKTGVTLKDSGIRDEHGMQPLEDLFSSPHKPTEDRDEAEAEDEEDGGASEDGRADSEDMDITTTSGIAPAALLNGIASRLPAPVNRTNRSPVKVVVNSPARNRLMARSSSPTRGSLGANKENYDRGSSSQPAEDINTARRRLNFEALKAGGRSLSQPTTTNGSNGLNGYHDEEEEDETENSPVPDETDAFIEESMAMLEDDGEVEEEQSVEQEEDEPEASPEVVSAPAAKKKPERKPKAKEPSPAPAPAKRGRKAVAPAVEEQEQEEQEEGEEAGEEPEEVAPMATAKRGRGAKGKGAAVEEPAAPAAKPGRKRRTVEEPATDTEDSSASRQSKRQRTTETAPAPVTKDRGRPKKSLTPAPEQEVEEPEPERVAQAGPSRSKAAAKGKGRAPTPAAEPVNAKATKATKQKGGRKRQPSPPPAADADISIAIPRGPPLPKSRGLVINRREVPGDSNAIIRTRSGRHSFKPLAYWRNEHVDYEYEEDEFVVDHAPKSSQTGSKEVRKRKFVLPTIKEVVRVEEEVVNFSRGGGRGRGSTKRAAGSNNAAAASGRRAQQQQQQKDEDPSPPEPWELNPGILGGDVVTWYPQHEFHPPALDDEVEVQEKQLAISGRAIRTQKVKDAAFRYAKTVNEGFFGAGVVDLPPGAVKRPKNSRKMFMTFFVYTGRVLVTVNESVFRIGKGGMWFVPRGNYYSIENDYDTPARVFFSQGCEVQVRPSEEGGEEGTGTGTGSGIGTGTGAENSMIMDTSAVGASYSSA
ncbi:kinetochore CENP-C fungal-like protein [Sordaria sp. MPI-SDFR-AT-0083]|nr:kinetochore CENP-C fungal-like protein [Sordaria sp. MPI-SDFR-AT-0083]